MKHISEILDKSIAELEAIRNYPLTESECFDECDTLLVTELAAQEDMQPYNVADSSPEPHEANQQ